MPGKSEQFCGWCRLYHFSCRVLFQHVGIVRQLLYICRYVFPIRAFDIVLHLLRKGVLIPCRAIFRILKQSLVFQIPAARLAVSVQVCRQVGLDTAFGRVDLKPRQDGKRFGFLSALFIDVSILIFVVSENTAVKCGIGICPTREEKVLLTASNRACRSFAFRNCGSAVGILSRGRLLRLANRSSNGFAVSL